MLDGLSATTPSGAPPAALATVAAVLACPMCRAELEIEACQAEYQQLGRAATYNLQFQRTLLERSSTRREYSLIDRHIRRVGHTRAVLDIPCGDGPLEAGVNP